MNKDVLSISQILKRNQGNAVGAINQLFNLLSTQSDSSRSAVQKAILFSMESLHEWNNILIYAQKWKAYSYMKELVSRMKKRLNEDPQTSAQVDFKDELKRLIQKYWMTRSPKKNENVYKELILARDTTNTVNPGQVDKFKNNQREIKSLMQTQNYTKKQTPEFVSQPPVAKNEPQYREKNDPLTGVTGRPTILKKSSILAESLKPKENKIDLPASKVEKNEAKLFQNVPKNDTVIKLLLNFNKNQNQHQQQQRQQRQRQKQESSRPLLIQPPKIPTKNVDEECPPERFNFGSSKKSEIHKAMTVSPKKYDPDQCIIKIKKRQTIPAPKPEPVSEIKSICEFSFTKQKELSPKQIEKNPDTNNFDSFYEVTEKQKYHQRQPVEPVMIQRPPKVEVEEVVVVVADSPPLFINSQITPRFDIESRFLQPRKYVECLTEDQLKMVGPDVKPTNQFKKICQRLGLVAMKYFNQALKLDF